MPWVAIMNDFFKNDILEHFTDCSISFHKQLHTSFPMTFKLILLMEMLFQLILLDFLGTLTSSENNDNLFSNVLDCASL